MDILDDREALKKLDQGNTWGSVAALAKQCEHAWQDTQKIEVPADYQSAEAIIVFGMGGSALGAHIIQTLFSDRLKVPFFIVNDYHIPAWVNERTLVILSS